MKRAVIKAGWGFNVGGDFARAKVDTPVELAPEEFAKPHHVIGYITGDKSSPLGFMRADRVRVHVPTAALIEVVS